MNVQKRLCARWVSMIYLSNLTLPGTVGRGFYVFSIGIFSRGKNDGTWIFVCYANIRKQKMSFSVGETRTKNRKAVFYGMEAAA